MEVIVEKNNQLLIKGHEADVREHIEEMLEERLGLFLELQEETEDGEFRVYLHTDCYDYLTEKEVSYLENMKIDDCDATEGIKRLLNINFKVA